MFYCEDCRKKNGWPESVARLSCGRCECCDGVKVCHDVHHRYLPPVKEASKDETCEQGIYAADGSKTMIYHQKLRLIEFFYILCRDHLPIGFPEKILQDDVAGTTEAFSNQQLAYWAEDFVERLTDQKNMPETP